MPPPVPLPADTLVIYTDGSGPIRGSSDASAGWGFTVVTGGDGDTDDRGVEVHSRCGPVITDASNAAYIGAQHATNNTAELTAVAQALKYVTAD